MKKSVQTLKDISDAMREEDMFQHSCFECPQLEPLWKAIDKIVEEENSNAG